MASENSLPSIPELEPQALWRCFAELSGIPRPSEMEGGVRDYLRQMAKREGWGLETDEAGNVCISVEASPDRENTPVTVLQAHMDMVCIKRASVDHDFEKDPIRLKSEKRNDRLVVAAEGTTLGADNGIGLCAALAAALKGETKHGPLELLFTVNEESGMTGAHGLDHRMLNGRQLINLDSEEDDAIYVGCVGGGSVSLGWTLPWVTPSSEDLAIEVTVSGLRGGHSGLEIHEKRGNAILVLARFLGRLPSGACTIAHLEGGSRGNAIPDSARAVLVISEGALDHVKALADQALATEAATLGSNAARLRIDVNPLEGQVPGYLSVGDTDRLAAAIAKLPHGVIAMDPNAEGTVETSCNVAIMRTEKVADKLHIKVEVTTRSLVQERLEDLMGRYETVAGDAGAEYEGRYRYPPWTPDYESDLLQTGRRVYEKLFGEEPRVACIHGGLECGLIGAKIPGMKMISIGPLIEEAHTPDECVYVESVQKFWKLLTALLDQLSR